jgi:predicted lipid-binding transport protein (Tim44 family)
MRQQVGRIGGELGHLVVGAAIGIVGPVLVSLMLLSVPASLAAGLGILLFVGVVWLTRRLADLQRRRAARGAGRAGPIPIRAVAARAPRPDPGVARRPGHLA